MQGFEDPAFTKHFEGWGPTGAVVPSPGANGAATGPPTAAPGQRRSSAQEAVLSNGAAAVCPGARSINKFHNVILSQHPVCDAPTFLRAF